MFSVLLGVIKEKTLVFVMCYPKHFTNLFFVSWYLIFVPHFISWNSNVNINQPFLWFHLQCSPPLTSHSVFDKIVQPPSLSIPSAQRIWQCTSFFLIPLFFLLPLLFSFFHTPFWTFSKTFHSRWMRNYIMKHKPRVWYMKSDK